MSQPVPGGEPQGRRRGVWRIVRLASGWALIGFGIVGLVLPILQGVAMIVAGLALLAPDLPWARRWLDWLRARMRQLKPAKKDETKSIEP